MAMGSPIDDQEEYLPPTKSQKVKILDFLIPNATTFCSLVDIAAKCFPIAFSLKDF